MTTSPRTKRLVSAGYMLVCQLGLLSCVTTGAARPAAQPALTPVVLEVAVAQTTVRTTLRWVYQDIAQLKVALLEDDLLTAFPAQTGYIRGLIDTIKIAGVSMTEDTYEPPVDVLAQDIESMSGHLQRLVSEIDQIPPMTTRLHLRQHALSALIWSRIAEQQARRAEIIRRVVGS